MQVFHVCRVVGTGIFFRYSYLSLNLLRYGSLIALYTADAVRSLPISSQSRPDRIFYSYERITCLDYSSTMQAIVCGTACGSLLLFDLRRLQNPSKAPGGLSFSGWSGKGKNSRDKKSFSEQMDHVPPAVSKSDGILSVSGSPLPYAEEGPAYSTDVLVLRSSDLGGTQEIPCLAGSGRSQVSGVSGGDVENEVFLPPFLSEIASVSVAASGGEVAVLDVQGVVSSWRILMTDANSVRLQYMTCRLDPSGPLATNVIHLPSEVASAGLGNYVVVAGHGVGWRQDDLLDEQDLTMGLETLNAGGSRGGGTVHLGLPSENLAGRFESDTSDSAPTDLKWHPLFPALLAVAYASGEVAIFDSALSVPLLTLQANPLPTDGVSNVGSGSETLLDSSLTSRVSVEWSTTRPTVLFVYAGNEIQAWDLTESVTQPVSRTDVKRAVLAFAGAVQKAAAMAGTNSANWGVGTPSIGSPGAAAGLNSGSSNLCLPPVMHVIPAGPEAGMGFIILGGKIHTLLFGDRLVTPLANYPTSSPHAQLWQQNKYFDSRYNLFDRLKDNLKMMQKIIENKGTKLEIDILHKLLLMNH